MRFAQEFWLYLVPALPVLWFCARLGDRRTGARLAALLGAAGPDHVEGHNARLRAWDRFLFLTGMFFLLLALARPQWGASEVTVTQRGSDVVVALDISNSMLAEDVLPNRLERAKSELGTFLQRLQNSRVGLVFFAGAAFVQCPLTLDYGTAEIFLNLAGPDMLSEQGTAVGAALQTARELLAKGRGTGPSGAFQAILLVTDGEDLEGQWETAAQACLDDGIKLIPVGVGEESGGLIPIQDLQGRSAGYLKGDDGSVVMTRLEMAFLERLASMGGGSPFRIGVDGLAGDRLFSELQRLGQRDLEDRRISAYQERYLVPLLLAVLCLGLRLALRSRFRRGGTLAEPGMTALATVAATLTCLAAPVVSASVLSPEVARVMDEGRQSYLQGDYPAALAQFGSALVLRPDDPRISLAMGETLHRLQKYQEAVREFDRAASLTAEPELLAEAHYNAGTSLLAAGDAGAAVERYRSALGVDPDQQDALRNLEIALRRLQEQQDQEKKEQEQQDQEQQEKEQQEQDNQEQGGQDQQQEQEDGEQDQKDQQQNKQQQDKQQQDKQQQDKQQQDQHQQEQQAQEEQEHEQQEQEQQQQDQPSDQQQTGQDVQPDESGDQELTREQAMQILKALDRDEEELRRSVQQRIKGGKPKSGKRW